MSSDPSGAALAKLERAIVLQLLDGEPRDSDGPSQRGCSLPELLAAVGAEPMELEQAITGLLAVGIVELSGQDVSVSAVALRLDELGLIGI